MITRSGWVLAAALVVGCGGEALVSEAPRARRPSLRVPEAPPRPVAQVPSAPPPAAPVAAVASEPVAAVAREPDAPAAIVLEAPPFEHTVREAVRVAKSGPVPRLVRLSQARNAITDDADWFARNKLTLGYAQPRSGPGSGVPHGVPSSYGAEALVGVITHPDHTIALYAHGYGGGRHVLVLGADQRTLGLLDFGAYASAPTVLRGDEAFVEQRVRWAEVIDGVLYVASGHRTYARSSGGKNAYLTALDLATGRLLWRSAPLVANSANFLVKGGVIVTGYGFTDEPDFLYLLDRETGKTLSRTSVASGPDFILERDGKLFVRTYDTDYVFELR